MGRLHLAVGTRYEREGRTCLVLQVLRDGRLVVEDQSGGGQGVVTRDEVTAAWERGALRFAVRGPGVRARGGGGVGHGVHDRRCPPGGGGGAVSRGQAASGLAMSPTLRLRRLGGGGSMLRHVGADLHDDLNLAGASAAGAVGIRAARPRYRAASAAPVCRRPGRARPAPPG